MKQKNKTRLARAAMTLLLALLTTFGAWAQTTVEIGEGTSAGYYNPLSTYYNYSITEQLYTADEIGMAGSISSISFNYVYNTANKEYEITVYMANVDAEDLSTGISLADADEVFSGTIYITETGWVTINLDTPFAYDGTSNLLIGINKTAGSQWFSGSTWQYTTTETNMARYTQNDSNPYTISTVPGSATKNRPNIQIEITPGSGPVCNKPETLEASNVTSNSAVLTWTGGSGTYNVEYKLASAEDWTSLLANTTSTSYTLTGLAPGKAYQARVQSVCGEDVSGWKSVSFTTMFGIPLVEGFASTSIPMGWIKYTGLLSNVQNGGETLSTTSSGWSFGTNNGVFDSHARVNIYGTSCKYWLVTPSLLMENNVQLTFDLALTAYSDNLGAPQTTGTDDRFVVLITTDDGTTWTALRQWDNAGSEYVYNDIACSAVGQNVSIDLSSYAGQNIAIAFYAESTQSNADNNLHIDNVSIDYIPDCAKPTGLTVSNVTSHEATITWTSDADAWQIQLGDNAAIDVTDKTYTFTSLTPETAYSVKVRTNCGGTYSDWTNPFSFTTTIACPIPTNVATSNITGHGVTITWNEVEGAMFQCALVKTSEYDANNINWSELFEENTQSWSNLDPETNYTFALRKDCGSEDGYSSVVTKNFTTTVACPTPTVTVSNITTTTAVVSCTNTEADHFNVMLGEEVVAQNVAMPYTLNGLTTNTTYTVKVQAVCGGEDGESSYSNGTTFTTAEACPDGKVCIGTGTATNNYLPANNYYKYSLTEQIYTAEEIGEAGAILSIDFYKASTNEMVKDLDIYIVSTDKEEFESGNDWIPVTTSDLVFSGTVTFADNDWTTIELDNPFVYDGTSNICIVVDNNTGDYVSSTGFRVFTAEKNQTIYQYSDNDNLDPTTSLTTTAYKMTSKNRIRLGIGEPPACAKPTGLAVNYEGGTTATVTWNGEAGSYNIDVNGTVTNGVTSPYTLNGLELGTTYQVKVQAVCSESAQSEWTSPVSFTTDLCMPEDMCEITFELTDSYGDGWNGAYIDVVDVATGTSLGHMTNENLNGTTGSGTNEVNVKTLRVCDGRDIQFVWHSGSYDSECSYMVTDINGDEIFSGNGAMSAPVNYTVNCTVTSCRKPTDLAAAEIGPHSAVLSWTENGEATAWMVAYKKSDDVSFTETDASTNPFMLEGLDAETAYTVKVAPVCEVEKWSDEITFTTDIANAAPKNLAVSDITHTSATVTWTSEATEFALEYVEGSAAACEWYHYDNGEFGDAIGTGGGQFSWGVMFPAGSYEGNVVNTVSVYDYEAMTGTVSIYNDGDTAPAGDAVSTMPITLTGAGEFVEVSFDSQAIDNTKNVWIVVYNESGANYPAAMSTNNDEPNGRWVSIDGTNWEDIANYDLQGCFMIRAEIGSDVDPSTLTWTSVDNPTSPCTLTGLNPETQYTVRVKAIYGGEVGESVWKYKLFTTLPAAEILFAKEGYATYYNGEKDVVLPAGMKAHVVTDGSTNLTYAGVADGDTDGNVVPAGTAVLLQVEPSTEAQNLYVSLATPSAAAYTGTNFLFGSDEATTTTGGAKYYKLTYSDNNDNFGWYWGADEGAAFTSPAHKAWLALPASGAPFFGLPDDSNTTGIMSPQTTTEDGEWYTLQGMKVGKKPTTAGVYIHNGKKVLIP